VSFFFQGEDGIRDATVTGVQTCALPILRSVTLEVDQGEVVALIGSNGAGKTTTLRTISGLMHPAGGSINFDTRDITNTGPETIRSEERRVGKDARTRRVAG